jgi:hypothetical protein
MWVCVCVCVCVHVYAGVCVFCIRVCCVHKGLYVCLCCLPGSLSFTPIILQPSTLLEFVFDFGTLHPSTEERYIESILDQVLVLPDMFKLNPPYGRSVIPLVTRLVCASHLFLRNAGHMVSLRDVTRFARLFNWFAESLQTRYAEIHGRKGLSLRLRDSLVLALGLCYQARLGELRFGYAAHITGQLNGPAGRRHAHFALSATGFQERLEEEERFYVEQIRLPPGIALNRNVLEQVFVTLVCILNRVPVFVVGKPGTSKSLSLELIASNLNGQSSESEFFRQFPAVEIFSYQCSPLSTSTGIEQCFEHAARYQQNASNTQVVVLLDEVGLAEQSPYRPLKVLHALLEEAQVAVVGISNWQLDLAKMNRAVHLQRPEPLVRDLEQTALGIVRSRHLEGALRGLSAAYHHVYNTQPMPDFFGLRDFYSLVKYLHAHLAEHGNALTEELLRTAIHRNFGGIPSARDLIERAFLDRTSVSATPSSSTTLSTSSSSTSSSSTTAGLPAAAHLSSSSSSSAASPVSSSSASFAFNASTSSPSFSSSSSSSSSSSLRSRSSDNSLTSLQSRASSILQSARAATGSLSAVSLIHANLIDEEARHLMIMSDGGDEACLRLCFQLGLLDHGRVAVLFGSDFEGDRNELETCLAIQRLKRWMAEGRVCAVVRGDGLFESLYDMLNQHYIIYEGRRFVRLALGTHSRLCPVHPRFRLLVTIDRRRALALAPPLLNRFEKQVLQRRTLLTPLQRRLADRLAVYLRPLFDAVAGKHAELVVGYCEETLPSLVQSVVQPGFNDEEALFEEALWRLQLMLRPEGLVRVRAESVPFLWQWQQRYFLSGVHQSLSGLLRACDRHPERWYPDAVGLQLVVITFAPLGADLAQCVAHAEELSAEQQAYLQHAVDVLPAEPSGDTVRPAAQERAQADVAVVAEGADPATQPSEEAQMEATVLDAPPPRLTLVRLHEVSTAAELQAAIVRFFAPPDADADAAMSGRAQQSGGELLLLDCDLAATSMQRVAHAQYLCEEARAQWADRHPALALPRHLVLVVHLSRGRSDHTYRLEADRAWRHVVVDSLAGSPRLPSTWRLLRGSHEAELLQEMDMLVLLRAHYRSCLARLIYPVARSTAAIRAQIAMTAALLDDRRFVPVLMASLNSLLLRRHASASHAERWQLAVADDVRRIAASGNLRQALHQHLVSVLLDAFATLFAGWDRNFNVELYSGLLRVGDDREAAAGELQVRRLWLQLAEVAGVQAAAGAGVATSPAVLGGEGASLGAASGLTVQRHDVLNDGPVGRLLRARFPFSSAFVPVGDALRDEAAQVADPAGLPASLAESTQRLLLLACAPLASLSAPLLERYRHDLMLMLAPSTSLPTPLLLGLCERLLVEHAATFRGAAASAGLLHAAWWSSLPSLHAVLQLVEHEPACVDALVRVVFPPRAPTNCEDEKRPLFELELAHFFVDWLELGEQHLLSAWLPRLLHARHSLSALVSLAAELAATRGLAAAGDALRKAWRATQLVAVYARLVSHHSVHACVQLRHSLRQVSAPLHSSACAIHLLAHLHTPNEPVREDARARSEFFAAYVLATLPSAEQAANDGALYGDHLLDLCVGQFAQLPLQPERAATADRLCVTLQLVRVLVRRLQRACSESSASAPAAVALRTRVAARWTPQRLSADGLAALLWAEAAEDAYAARLPVHLDQLAQQPQVVTRLRDALLDSTHLLAHLDAIGAVRALIAASTTSAIPTPQQEQLRALLSRLLAEPDATGSLMPARLLLLKEVAQREGIGALQQLLSRPAQLAACLPAWVEQMVREHKPTREFVRHPRVVFYDPFRSGLPARRAIEQRYLKLSAVFEATLDAGALAPLQALQLVRADAPALLLAAHRQLWGVRTKVVLPVIAWLHQQLGALLPELQQCVSAARLLLREAARPEVDACSPHVYLLSSICVHLLVVVVEQSVASGAGAAHTSSVLRALVEQPEFLTQCFLPAQPADAVVAMYEVMGGRWYACSKGHKYYVDQCM